MTIIPLIRFMQVRFMDLVVATTAFPGYYYTKLIQDLTEKQTTDAVTQLALLLPYLIEFTIFLSACTQRKNGELGVVKEAGTKVPSLNCF